MKILLTLLALSLNLSQIQSLHRTLQATELYPTRQEIETKLDDIVASVHPDSKIQFDKIKCNQDYDFLEIKGRRDLANPYLQSGKPLDVFIICNIHARQFITSLVCMSFIEELYTLSKQLSDSNSDDPKFRLLPPFVEYKIYPIANANRQNALTIDNCIRKNKDNIDLNRNFPTEFNIEKYPPSSEGYGGTQPISEPFSKCVNKQFEQKLPDFFLDIHSGEVAFYYQDPRPANKSLENQLAIIDQVTKAGDLCEGCRVTTLAKDGENINGHIFGDLKVRKKIKYSILIEIYGKENISKSLSKQNKCFLFFNPSTQRQRDNSVRKWTNIVKKMVNDVLDRQHNLQSSKDQKQ